MTIRQAIGQVDSHLVNTYTQKDKLGWLDQLDRRVKTLILDTHEGEEGVSFSGYDTRTEPDTQLLVKPPYDEIYLRWLEAQIHYHNGEYDKYNSAIALYNTAYDGYRNDYNRTHMPKGRKLQFV